MNGRSRAVRGGSGLGLGEGDPEAHAGSGVGSGDGGGAVVGFGDCLEQGEPESGAAAAAAGLGTYEPVEGLADELGGEPGPSSLTLIWTCPLLAAVRIVAVP